MKKEETILASMIAAIICIVLSLVLVLGGGSKENEISVGTPNEQTVSDTVAPTQATTAPAVTTT